MPFATAHCSKPAFAAFLLAMLVLPACTQLEQLTKKPDAETAGWLIVCPESRVRK